MRQINPAHVEALLEMLSGGPYLTLLGMKITEVGDGFSRVEIELGERHTNPFGIVHGGVFSSVIDTAAYMAVYCGLDEDVGLTTLDLTVNNLAMTQNGRLVAEGRAIKTGSRICLAETYVRDGGGRLLAHGTSKLMIIDGRQSMEQAVRNMGYAPLPPKFLG